VSVLLFNTAAAAAIVVSELLHPGQDRRKSIRRHTWLYLHQRRPAARSCFFLNTYKSEMKKKSFYLLRQGDGWAGGEGRVGGGHIFAKTASLLDFHKPQDRLCVERQKPD